jgi:hypothetical protein
MNNHNIICHNTTCKHWNEDNLYHSDENKMLIIQYCGRLHNASDMVIGTNGECLHKESKSKKRRIHYRNFLEDSLVKEDKRVD